ncbi:MAG TPA: hypothetical protein VM101_05025 [Flavitalea sp.]|nr:hypothetical protein [Flavitalea sp.]
MTPEQVENTSLVWQRINDDTDRYRHAIVDGEPVLLRLNNYPDEPEFTFIFFKNMNEFLIYDVRGQPKPWKIMDYNMP